jgi:hypothetical protein
MNYSKSFKFLLKKMLNSDLNKIPDLKSILIEVMSLNEMKTIWIKNQEKENLKRIKNERKKKRCITL